MEVISGYRGSVWYDKVFEMDSGDVCATIYMSLMPLNLKIGKKVKFVIYMLPQ